MLKYLLILLLLTGSLMGCESMQRSPAMTQLVVNQVIGRYIQTADDWPEKALRVERVLTSVQDAASGELVTVTVLKQVVLDHIGSSDLTPVDSQLAIDATGLVGFELERLVGDGVLDPDDTVTVRQFLAWAIQATKPYQRLAP